MPKILTSDDTANLIKVGCSKVYSDNMNEITAATTKLHKLQQDVADLYNLPLDIEKYFAMQRTGKLYQVKVPKDSYNTTPTCIKTLDNEGLQCEPSTDTVTNVNDYASIDLFKWYNCNYIRNGYGEPIITYREGDTGYTTTGAVDVGCFGMSFYYSYLDGADYDNLDDNYYYLTISDKPNNEWYLQPWIGCVRHDGTVAPYWCYSKYYSGKGSDGELRSQPNLLPVLWMSYDRMRSANSINEDGLTNHSGGYQHKGEGYHGAGTDRMLFGYIFFMIKYASKSNQTKMYGCCNYNFQYHIAVQETTNSNHVILTTANASNIHIGCHVCVGYPNRNVNTSSGVTTYTRNNDRNTVNMRTNACECIVDSKQNVTIDGTTYTQVNLKYIDGTLPSFNTKEVMLDSNGVITTDSSVAIEFTTVDTFVSDKTNKKLCDIIISTMPWWSGTTDGISGFNDGSNTSNTNGHFPFRIQGCEYFNGAWFVCSDTVMNINSDYSTDFYVAQKGMPIDTSSMSIIGASDADTYTGQRFIKTGTMDKDVGGSTSFYIGNILMPRVSNKTTIYNNITYTAPVLTYFAGCRQKNNNSGQGVGDYCYRNTSTGLRECLLGGVLAYGAYSGFCSLHCGNAVSNVHWNLSSAD